MKARDHKPISKQLEIAGWAFLPGSAYLVAVTTYEAVVLTCRYGPGIMSMWYQMSASAKFAGISYLLNMVWFLILTLKIIRGRPRLLLRQKILAISAVSLILPIFVPTSAWRLLAVHTCSRRTNFAEFLIEGAGMGNRPLVRYLLEKGTDPNASGTLFFPDTPLQAASRNDQMDTVKLLLEHGAQACLRNQDGKTPAQIAQENGHSDIAAYLSKTHPCP